MYGAKWCQNKELGDIINVMTESSPIIWKRTLCVGEYKIKLYLKREDVANENKVLIY